MAIRVLFLCRDNAARSIMAEAVLNGMSKGEFEAASAGFEVDQLDPVALAVLKENFLETNGLRPKSVQDFAEETFDYVIELAGRSEHILPAPVTARLGRFRWGFPDPTGSNATPEERTHALRRMVVELRLRMALFIAIVRREARVEPAIEVQAFEMEEVA